MRWQALSVTRLMWTGLCCLLLVISTQGCAEQVSQEPATIAASEAPADAEGPTEAAPSRTRADDLQTLVYMGQSIPVDDLAQTIYEVYRDNDSVRLAPERQGNSLIIRAPGETLEEIAAMIRELDRPQKMTTFVVQYVRASTELTPDDLPSGSISEVNAAIDRLKGDGKAEVVARMQVTALENVATMMQVGHRKAVRTGTVNSSRGRQSTYNYMDLGSLLQVTHRVANSDVVIANLSFNLSALEPAPEADGGDDEEGYVEALPADVLTLTQEATLRIPSGQAVLVGRNFEQEDVKSDDEIYIVVSATVTGKRDEVSFLSETIEE